MLAELCCAALCCDVLCCTVPGGALHVCNPRSALPCARPPSTPPALPHSFRHLFCSFARSCWRPHRPSFTCCSRLTPFPPSNTSEADAGLPTTVCAGVCCWLAGWALVFSGCMCAAPQDHHSALRLHAPAWHCCTGFWCQPGQSSPRPAPTCRMPLGLCHCMLGLWLVCMAWGLGFETPVLHLPQIHMQDGAGLVPLRAGHLSVPHLRSGGQHGLPAREQLLHLLITCCQ